MSKKKKEQPSPPALPYDLFQGWGTSGKMIKALRHLDQKQMDFMMNRVTQDMYKFIGTDHFRHFKNQLDLVLEELHVRSKGATFGQIGHA
ncbi:hypothetical protein LCGC14_2982080 [marine sediment metagenome]|uniref:Uncharacterized protein n=1 Tax=marine sediment metagenome TaxID=412755 RepID=A0A0F8X694_9ZZZZ